MDTGSFATEFLNRFFQNGATFGGFLETDEESEERIKLIKAGLQNDHVGVANAHKLGVLPKGTKYAKTTANMAELEMGATDDRFRDKILAAFGVPKTQVIVYADGLREAVANVTFVAGSATFTFAAGRTPSSTIAVDYLRENAAEDSDLYLPADLVEVCEAAVVRIFKKRESEGRSSEAFGESSITWQSSTFREEDMATIKNYRRGYHL